MMSRQIVPSGYLERCPTCNSLLTQSTTLNEKYMACSHCDYRECCESAAVMTFLSAGLSEYAALHSVDTAFLKGNEFTSHECMEANGLLPLFVQRAEQIQSAAGLENIPGLGLQLKVVEDVKGLWMSRVVTKGSSINIAVTLSFLSEVLHETMYLTNQLGKQYYGNQICLDYMPNMNTTVDVSETARARLQRALEVATKHQAMGASNDLK